MIKILGSFLITFSLLFVIGYGTQTWLIEAYHEQVRFNVWSLYWFFSMTSLVICISFLLLSTMKSLISQLGFLYLPTLFIKGLLFFIFFKGSVFGVKTLTLTERMHLLIPMFVFLFVEAYFIIRILKKLNSKF